MFRSDSKKYDGSSISKPKKCDKCSWEKPRQEVTFLKKSNQKTFAPAGLVAAIATARRTESLFASQPARLFLQKKKFLNDFPTSTSLNHAARRSRMPRQHPRRPDRPRHQPAAAVRADIPHNPLRTRRTKRALITANPRIRRLRRQILIAALATRPKLQHR